MNKYEENIGLKCVKCSITEQIPNRKPFKSGFLENTIKGVIPHPNRPKTSVLAYVFLEDDSYVECRRCLILK